MIAVVVDRSVVMAPLARIGARGEPRGRLLAVLAGIMWLSIAAALAQQEAPPAGQSPEESAAATKTVRVTADGYNHDDALKQALRKALEQGAGVQIASYSQTQDFMLVRDTIYSRAAGIVKDYRILSEHEAAGVTHMEVEATVRPDAVAREWGEVQNVLDQLGRPKIMVWIDERIDGELQRDSMVESRIEELFVKTGFDLVTRKALGDVPWPELADVRDEKGLSRLQQIVKEAGAHILIRGSANANRAGIENIYGALAAFYNCDVQARIYNTDTGRLLASESIPSTRRGVRSRHEFSPQAAREALVQATFPENDGPPRAPALAIKLYESVMGQWATILSAGGDIELDVKPLSFNAYLSLKKALAEIEGIKSVEGDFSDEAARYRIKAALSASTLAELLTRKPLADWLEVTDLKLNRIRARGLATAASSQQAP